MKRFLLALVGILAFSACSKEKKKNEGAEPVNKLTATQWCSFEGYSDLMVIKRFTFSQAPSEKVRVEYLRADENGSLISYKVGDTFDWSSDNEVTLNTYSIELKDLPPTPSEIGMQDGLFEIFLKANPKIKPSTSKFDPQLFVKSKQWSTSLLSSEVVETNLFPCSSFTNSFTTNGLNRPIIEHSLILSQNDWGMRKYKIASASPISLPVNIVDASTRDLSGTHWCSWLEYGRFHDDFNVDVISFGKDKYLKSTVTSFTLTPEWEQTEEQLLNSMKWSAERGSIYKVLSVDKYIDAETTLVIDTKSYQLPKSLVLVKDANGNEMLTSVNSETKLPRTLYLFSEIYFNCSNPRPFQVVPKAKVNLDKYLTFVSDKLAQP